MKPSIYAAFVASIGMTLLSVLPSSAQILHRINIPLRYYLQRPASPFRKPIKHAGKRRTNATTCRSGHRARHRATLSQQVSKTKVKATGLCATRHATRIFSISRLIARNAEQVATRQNTIGNCYAGVCNALRPLGIKLTGAAAWMAQQQLENDGRFKTVSIKSLKPGDIVVHGKSKAHPYGHIAVYLGNQQEASDHVQELITTNGDYGETLAFRFTGV